MIEIVGASSLKKNDERNKMFECECTGCFDTAEYDATFTDMAKAQICESCLDYLTERGLVLMSSRHINAITV